MNNNDHEYKSNRNGSLENVLVTALGNPDTAASSKPVPTTYYPRIGDGLLQRALLNAGAVQIVGPKWCGKTTTAEQVAQQAIYFQDPDVRDNLLRIANDKPSVLLEGAKPLLLDEWQDAPKIWDAVRFAVDRNKNVGQFILTGSVISNDKEIKHSGTGRISRIRMRTMSLYESGESSGEVSLSSLLRQEAIQAQSRVEKHEIAHMIVRGGWPSTVTNKDSGMYQARDYVESIIESDISKVDGIDKNPKRVRLLMRSLARNESTKAAMTTIQADMSADEGVLSTNTIAVYLNALRRLYVLEEQEAWAPAVRSKTAIRTSPIRRYCDPSIATAILRLTPEKLIADYHTFGMLFESLCIRDLRTYAESIDATVYHYRDARGLECDAVIEYGDGRWGACEIKLNNGHVDQAAVNLLKIQQEVRSQHGGEAQFLMVISTGGYAYRRSDGVYLVPIECLCP